MPIPNCDECNPGIDASGNSAWQIGEGIEGKDVVEFGALPEPLDGSDAADRRKRFVIVVDEEKTPKVRIDVRLTRILQKRFQESVKQVGTDLIHDDGGQRL